MMKERSYGLDVVRVLACFMVIVMHSPIPNTNQDSNLILACISYFTATCIGLFFYGFRGTVVANPRKYYKFYK